MTTPARRVVAAILPELLCELGTGSGPVKPETGRAGKRARRDDLPLGVVLVDPEAAATDAGSSDSSSVLTAVNAKARHYGVRAGQTVAEARAFVAHLVVREVTKQRVNEVLGQVAEVALAFGPSAGIETPDTIWVDVTGTAHLVGGEAMLVSELCARVRALGHVTRAAISNGPRLAQAFARWLPPIAGEECAWVISPEQTRQRIAALPVVALPIDPERASFLVRLGIHTVGKLAELPRAATASRLGEDASVVLDLASGNDASIIPPYTPVAVPSEDISWDESFDGVEPLLFALRGLVSRLSARLEGRGQSSGLLELAIEHDRAVARLKQIPFRTVFPFELASPLYRSEDLFRVISTRLQRLKLDAPTIGLELRAKTITRTLALQMSLRGSSGAGVNAPEALPVLLAELAADIGKSHFGVLEVVSTHRPERESRLAPVSASEILDGAGGGRRSKRPETRIDVSSPGLPTRLLPRPVPIEAALRIGATLSVDHELYAIERVEFSHRLDAVEWWSGRPTSRDYLRVWLKGAHSGFEALVYVNRETGTRFLQAICD